ncbi:MAG: GNAT family N-acetyltransferase [Bauldia sp.]|nr:GNAT family N-acetyltransferase [Bauldia sp.]
MAAGAAAPRPAVTIAVESPLQDDLRELIAALNAYLIPLSPLEFQFKMTVDQMARPDTTVFVARDAAGRAVGCGALKVQTADMAEVKRMFTRPELRGQRIGAAILDEIERVARDKGIATLMLETGEAPGFEPAYRLYENAGFTVRGAFLDYPDSGWSRFYEKSLR